MGRQYPSLAMTVASFGGHRNLLSAGTEPIWGQPTSTIDFCEPNYVMPWVAEFANSASALPLIWLPAAGLRHACLLGLGSEIVVAYAVILVVGIGTLLFHGTLTRAGQIIDEVPMIWSVLALLHAVLIASEQRHGLNNGFGRRGELVTFGALATLVYFQFGFDVFLLLYIASICVLLLTVLKFAFFASPRQFRAKHSTRMLFLLAAAVYIGGFVFLWLPGEGLCHKYPHIFEHLPMHAIFHLTSTAGPHLVIVAIVLYKYDGDLKCVDWTSAQFFYLPAINRPPVMWADPSKDR